MLDHGFNERFAGASAGAIFGDGCYFAEDITKSNQYAMRDEKYKSSTDLKDFHQLVYGRSYRHPGNVFYVILARVVLGCCVQTKSTAQTQPGVFALDGKNRKELANVPNSQPPHPFHSLLGLSFERFREFICFHSDQIYPEYIIAYQRCDK
jgi:hypothetical protein